MRKDSDDWLKKDVLGCRQIILQIVLIFVWAFFEMLALAVEFRLTFHGFGDPPSALTGRECLIITIMHFFSFGIMIAVYISNIFFLHKRKVKFRRYLQMTFFVLVVVLMSIGLVWLFATNFPDIWSGVMGIILDFIDSFADKGVRKCEL